MTPPAASTKHRLIAFGILLFYVFFRYLFTAWMEPLGEYASYYFEVIFLILAFIYYRHRIKLFGGFSKRLGIDLAVSFVLGFFIFKFAGLVGTAIPFDLKQTELIIFVLFIGPILEELLFRHALWFSLEDIFKKPKVVLVLSAVLYSFSHLYAVFFVPPTVRGFVLYQAVYTLALGLWWSWWFSRAGALSAPYLLHLLFNLGFFAASWVFT